MHLCQPSFVDVAPGLLPVPVVGAPIGIEGTEEPLGLNHLTSRSTSSTGTARADARPIRLSGNEWRSSIRKG
jgi:hypothetical protein